ncbi:MAG: DUF2141 domain-containing protein [Leptolyngbyaceae cyanobacterium SL_7_1]|nr:DUF2141 domain-containing protein [Leptolyngbyaceae cyanobacterium SL_7_1]
MATRSQLVPLLLATVGSVVISSAADAQLPANLTGSITIEVSDLQDQEGNICFKLFSGRQGFPNDDEAMVKRECVSISEHLATSENADFTVTFDDLTYGTYALAIYHDRNQDGELNRGMFGMPIEGYGFSNDAPAVDGPAQFDDAVFFLAGSNTTIAIRMKYPQ